MLYVPAFTPQHDIDPSVVMDCINRRFHQDKQLFCLNLDHATNRNIKEFRLVHPGEAVTVADRVKVKPLQKPSVKHHMSESIRSHFFGEFPLRLHDEEPVVLGSEYVILTDVPGEPTRHHAPICTSRYVFIPRTVAYSLIYNKETKEWEVSCYICVKHPDEWEGKFAGLLTSPVTPRSRAEILPLPGFNPTSEENSASFDQLLYGSIPKIFQA